MSDPDTIFLQLTADEAMLIGKSMLTYMLINKDSIDGCQKLAEKIAAVVLEQKFDGIHP